MSKSIHNRSFAYGAACALLLACLVGAARNVDRRGPQYDAVPVGGSGLQIVAHGTNTLYNYRRVKEGDVVTYKLVETIDLSVAGRNKIVAKPAE